MAMEYIIIGMVANIKDNGRMISKMGQEKKYGLIMHVMKDNIKMELRKVKDYLYGMIKVDIQERLLII